LSLSDRADSAALFVAHREGLIRYLTRIVGQPDTARDLTQEVFLRVTRAGVPDSHNGHDDGSGRRAWVFTIARNLALNHLRDQQRQPSTTSMIDVAQSGTQELSAAVHQALAALQDLDRDVFLLRETAGLNYDEIATACELTPSAVRNRLHRARMQLRASLSDTVDAQRQRGVRFTRND
jgi:RNA polymerase sigma-70 factor, ECF subfamily